MDDTSMKNDFTTRIIVILSLFWVKNVTLVIAALPIDIMPICPIDPLLSASIEGNSYFCPTVYDDGSPNPYVVCCQNDRPDERGNYYSCCKPDDEKEAEKWNKIEFIAIYIGTATAIIVVIVFLCVYCRKDTVHCLDGCTRKTKYRKDQCLDCLCVCLCCRHRATEMEQHKLNHVSPTDVILDTGLDSNQQLRFWNPVTNQYY